MRAAGAGFLPAAEGIDFMGLMRFVVTLPECITPEAVDQAYLSGVDRVPWPSQARIDGDELLLTRSVSDSGSLYVSWPIEGHGLLTLSTCTLMERPAPYLLPLELARGSVDQLRNQIADWRLLGLVIPEAISTKVSEAIGCLGAAAVNQNDRTASAVSAQRAIRVAADAGRDLAAAYVEQMFAARRRSATKTSCWLAGDLGVSLLDNPMSRQFPRVFNAAAVPLRWREVETGEGSFQWSVSDKQIAWCKAQRLKVFGGPLLRLDAGGIPDWLCLWEGDFDNLILFASEYAAAAAKRYLGKVDLWLATARANTADILSLSEEENLRLSARAVEVIHSVDPDTPIVISIDQPWAEYMSRREVDYPPWQFVEALVRSGSRLSGIALEINVGYHPAGTLPRTLLEFSRQLDRWSLLGLPLLVSVTASSGSHNDPLVVRGAKAPNGSTPQSQQAWIAQYLPLILAKSYVFGIIWNQLRDGEPHDFPQGGLFDIKGRPKPALQTLAAIRRTYLK